MTTLIFLLDLEVLDMRDEEDSLDTTVTSRYCTVLYCTVLYCTVLYCTVYCILDCTVLYCTLVIWSFGHPVILSSCHPVITIFKL